MSLPLHRTLNATYKRFGLYGVYNDKPVKIMRDTGLSFEHDLQEIVKIMSSELELIEDAQGIQQLPKNEITIENKTKSIISFFFIGNENEEIGLILKGTRR